MADPSIVQAVRLPFQEAIDYLEAKVLKPASREHASWAEVYGAEHNRAVTVAGAASEALVSDFKEEVAKAQKNGTTLADFRKSFDDIVKRHGWQQRHEPGWRAQIIYETNMAVAHSAGRYAQMTDPDVLEMYPYWQYVHSGSRHPRLQHLAWNGKTLRADDGWWDAHYPPNGWHCGCSVRPISEARLRRSGRTEPDKAPETTYRPWRNPATGEVRYIPNGIDPGWDYNVGKAGSAPPPATARTGVAAPPIPSPPVARQAPVASADDIRAFVERPRGEIVVGQVPEAARSALAAGTDVVRLSEDTLEKQAVPHADLGLADYLALPTLLAHPELVLLQDDGRVALLRRLPKRIAATSGTATAHLAIVKATEAGDQLYVVSLHRARPKSVRQKLRRSKVISGAVRDLE
jgi:hypothetical protein